PAAAEGRDGDPGVTRIHAAPPHDELPVSLTARPAKEYTADPSTAARLVAARLALAADGQGVTLRVVGHLEANRLALTLLIGVGDELRISILRRPDRQVAVELIDGLQLLDAAQGGCDRRGAALARPIVID